MVKHRGQPASAAPLLQVLEHKVAAIDSQVAASERRITALEEAQELSPSAVRLVRASSSGSTADTAAALQVRGRGGLSGIDIGCLQWLALHSATPVRRSTA